MTEAEQEAYLRERGFYPLNDQWARSVKDHAAQVLVRTSDGMNPETKRWTAMGYGPKYGLVVRWNDNCELVTQAYALAELRGWE